MIRLYNKGKSCKLAQKVINERLQGTSLYDLETIISAYVMEANEGKSRGVKYLMGFAQGTASMIMHISEKLIPEKTDINIIKNRKMFKMYLWLNFKIKGSNKGFQKSKEFKDGFMGSIDYFLDNLN
ncbi:hypothetical protein LN736_06260 [Clostridium sp. WLY-B-L2]|uniref:Uncharacterized protein n=1 Tax=Clostridium aromativorans TaxID=2836848 RepID=A0ABS8N3R7_9CLOT|nr:hypothetical protein [Clostridium aromativorans]MCC9294460.1 hypothetical protein [Clostridium aromativorans]